MKNNKTETKITYIDPNLLPSHVEGPDSDLDLMVT